RRTLIWRSPGSSCGSLLAGLRRRPCSQRAPLRSPHPRPHQTPLPAEAPLATTCRRTAMPSSLIDSRPLLMTCLLVFGLSASACRKPAAAVEVEREAPIEVNTTEVSTVEVPKILRLTGTLRGAKQTDLAANVAGRVQATLVERGTQVKRGTVLARVDVSQAA